MLGPTGDAEVDIVGFSRGSAIAFHFASKIQHAYGADQPIRFFGLFEVVGSFGIPGVRWDLGWNLEAIPENVDVCYHALVLDDGRATFPLTRPSASPANDDADASGRLFEVWFRGAHSDIGGGNGNTGLASITLTWMLVRAIHHRLPIPEDVVERYRRLRRPGTAVKHSLLDTGVRARTVQWHDFGA